MAVIDGLGGGFNSRSRVGSDDRETRQAALRRRFNSRSRVGSDPQTLTHPTRGNVSIHAPAWGATRPPRHPDTLHDVSIHAPAWGATQPFGRL